MFLFHLNIIYFIYLKKKINKYKYNFEFSLFIMYKHFFNCPLNKLWIILFIIKNYYFKVNLFIIKI